MYIMPMSGGKQATDKEGACLGFMQKTNPYLFPHI